jgi:diguanylate cyclase
MNTLRGLRKGAWPRGLLRSRPESRWNSPPRPAGHAEPEALQAATTPTYHGSRSRPRVGAWLALLIAVLVAVGAGYSITRVHDYAADRARLQTLLGQLETATRHQSALEWQAIAEQRLSPELDEEQRAVDAATHRLAAQFAMRDATSDQARAVHHAFEIYDAAVEDEFALLGKGQLTQAEEVDEQRVDPAFERLAAALASAGRRYQALAERANRQADLGTLLILLAAASIIGALVWRVQRANSQAAKLFAYQAHHDPLTALHNRALLVEQLHRELARASRRNEPVVLLWLDLDDFKVVNDSLGHHAGDQLLLAVGERLRGCLRPGDLPARMGGDEFTVLLADLTGLQDAIGVAERVGAELAAPFEVAGHQVAVHASIGIAESLPDQTTAQELLRNADIAMYEAKKQGKGQWQVFTPGMDSAAWKRLELEAELQVALEQQQFELYYQPILDLDSGAVSELEALVRWDHPAGGCSHRPTSSPWPSRPA